MIFSNQRFSSPSIREYQTSKRDSGPGNYDPSTKTAQTKDSTTFFIQPRTRRPWLVLRSLLKNFVVLSFDVILVYNTFFDDYPKSLDHVLDVLRIEKLFDYFSRRFDVVSLVVLKVQDKHDQFPRRESTGERQMSYVSGTWN
ncbi:hypothetical protein F2Q70_00004432 [Brassica cretica]|uniref:Uncharacterized protein n=1 Tax=Brassica cretica TaxID=69181 RepID=A0A8S9IUD1_BRACR|nr:hypothetical protein F2Q70_00004432 [Brassica cretica]